jgi:hypothetical protein
MRHPKYMWEEHPTNIAPFTQDTLLSAQVYYWGSRHQMIS